ncbi:MAG: hypothetical protein KKF56_03375 [Nanoarchaeota archaeon]|nr:hypothetical protein [Nanoarchaeota archaeon]
MKWIKNLFGRREELSRVEAALAEVKEPSLERALLLKQYLGEYNARYGAGVFMEEDYLIGLQSKPPRPPLSPRVITENPEPTLSEDRSNFLGIMEHVQGHVGLPQGVVQTVHSLDRYCRESRILGLANPRESEGYSVKVRLGKGLFDIDYDSRGAWQSMDSEFMVEGPVAV